MTGAWACARWSDGLRERFRRRFGADLLRRQKEDGSFALTENAWTTKANNTAAAVLGLLADRGRLSFTRPQPWSASVDRPVTASQSSARKWLAKHRRADGSYDGNWGARHVDLALTALVTLGDLASGSESTAKSVDYLASAVHRLAAKDWQLGHRSHLGFQLPMALVALCAHGQRSRRGARAVRHIVDRLVATQWADGGWSYDDGEKGNELYTLLSTTTGVVAALAVAHRMGYAVPAATLEKGIGYLRACANEDGGLRYCPDPKHPILAKDRARYVRSEPGRTLAGLGAMHLAGAGKDGIVQRGFGYLRPRLRQWLRGSADRHLWFNVFWASYAAPAMPGDLRKTWRAELTMLLARQRADGSFAWPEMAWSAMLAKDPMHERFATAVALYLLAWPR